MNDSYKLYLKYKNKYLKLKNSLQFGGSMVKLLSNPFDINIITNLDNLQHPYAILQDIVDNYTEYSTNKEKIAEIENIDNMIKNDIEMLQKKYNFILNDTNYENEVITFLQNHSDNTTSPLLQDFLVNAVKMFEKHLTLEFENNKLSDHGMIQYNTSDINVISFNLLDDKYTFMHMLYINIPTKKIPIWHFIDVYAWAFSIAFNNLRELRIRKTIELMEKYNPDVICFQEINLNMLGVLKKHLNTINFDNYAINKTMDQYMYKKEVKWRDQYRVVFYKSSNIKLDNNIHQYVSGEILFTGKGQCFIIHNNTMVVSLHISWKLNLYGKDREGKSNMENNYKQMGEFLKEIKNIVDRLNIFAINRIIIIGDTNNTMENLKKSIELNEKIFENINVYESMEPTTKYILNGGNKIDNVIEIIL